MVVPVPVGGTDTGTAAAGTGSPGGGIEGSQYGIAATTAGWKPGAAATDMDISDGGGLLRPPPSEFVAPPFNTAQLWAASLILIKSWSSSSGDFFFVVLFCFEVEGML